MDLKRWTLGFTIYTKRIRFSGSATGNYYVIVAEAPCGYLIVIASYITARKRDAATLRGITRRVSWQTITRGLCVTKQAIRFN